MTILYLFFLPNDALRFFKTATTIAWLKFYPISVHFKTTLDVCSNFDAENSLSMNNVLSETINEQDFNKVL